VVSRTYSLNPLNQDWSNYLIFNFKNVTGLAQSAIDESTHNSNTNHPHEQFIYQYMEQPQPDRELDDGHRISSHPSISTSTSQAISSSTTLKKSSSLISSDTSTNPYRTLKGFPYYIPQVSDSNNNEPEVNLGWRLVIKPIPSGSNARLIVKRIDESLNLTCTMEYVGGTNKTRRLDQDPDLGDDQIFRLAWHLPIMPQNRYTIQITLRNLPNSYY
jgi:hypothetical protein